MSVIDRINMERRFTEGKQPNIVETTDDKFDEDVIERSKEVPIVVDFWAPWCMPCRVLGPILERLAEEYGGRFILVKVNVEDNRLTGARFGIRSIPTVKMFKNGKIVDEFVGAMPEPLIRKWLDQHV